MLHNRSTTNRVKPQNKNPKPIRTPRYPRGVHERLETRYKVLRSCYGRSATAENHFRKLISIYHILRVEYCPQSFICGKAVPFSFNSRAFVRNILIYNKCRRDQIRNNSQSWYDIIPKPDTVSRLLYLGMFSFGAL